jgi:hypothetical protein
MEEDMRHRRINDAYSLMDDILSSKPMIHPIPPTYSAARPISPRAAAKERALKEKEKKRMKKHRQPPFFMPSPANSSVDFKSRGFAGKSGSLKDVGITVTDSDSSRPAKRVQFSGKGMCL